MKYISKIVKISFLLAVAAIMILSSCNKEPEQIQGPVTPVPTGISLGETITATADNSLYLALINRAGLLSTINNTATSYTMFVPDDNAMKLFVNAASGGAVPLDAPDAVFLGFISASLPVAIANAIVSYNIMPQVVRIADIPATFPNLQYPSIFNPAPSLSDLLRLTTFPSTINGNWINNIPLTAVDIPASNGVIHNSALLVIPPSRYLWDRINTDTGLIYLKAAILRADSGTGNPTAVPAIPGTLQSGLMNIGANLTVFAPTDAAFRTTLTGAIYLGLLPLVVQQLTAAYIAAGMTPAAAAAQAAIDAPPLAIGQATLLASTPDVFSNPLLYGTLTAQTVNGILAYHLFGKRAFTNNFPITPTLVPTLLNGAIPGHPGVTLSATFTLPFPFVTSATIKGAYNPTAANVIINASPFTPDPSGTSDQHYLNGVLHKIDQVLIPLPL
jgi:uncharacterized surface protein with fasciclin (FAS1) repeats